MAQQYELPHLDERLGHVAFDMGLMTKKQVADAQINMHMMKAESGVNATFSQSAMALGFITSEQLTAIEAEEQRRRRLISGYEIIDIIGTGTIATAYHARQLAMDREVALKVLHPRLASDPVFVKAYIAEAQAVSRFHHPHIVQGIDVGESNGFYYFAHEYLPGGSLANRLRSSPPERLSESRALLYLRQTTSALNHAWAVAVYHGDINPGNLLLDGQGNIKLANLGVPRVAKPKDGKAQDPRLGFVRCGPEYAAPEQLGNPELVNARTDIYNLGATFYHLSFGAPPFAAGPDEELPEFRRRNPMPPFSLKCQEEYSGKFLRLLHDMLEVDPEKRPKDPEDLSGRLENFHIADVDAESGLVRDARQSSGSFRRTTASGRFAARAPTAGAENPARKFSLKPRKKRVGAHYKIIVLVAAACAAALVAALLW